MKKIICLVLLFAGMLFASQIDITVQKGTDQSIISSFNPEPVSPEVDANVTIEVVFAEPINPMFAKRSVTLKRLTEKRGFFGFGKKREGKFIWGTAKYNNATHTITFTPDKPLSVGFYEVGFHHLMKLKPGKGMIIKPIIYRFYVPEVIDDFKLPPDPDEKKNNSTLLGIDFNHNGIRDDVERLIITHYTKDPKYPKTKTALALQYAWASQKILENPIIESAKYQDDALACEGYWIDQKTKGLSGLEHIHFSVKHRVFATPELKDKIFNTKERILRIFDFNKACSGQIFEGITHSIKNCMINIDDLGE